MEKRGVINDRTPGNSCGNSCGCHDEVVAEPTTKEAADVLEDGVTARVADAGTEEVKKKSSE